MEHREAVTTLATERYLLGEMSDQEREAFEAHYFDCADCAEDVRAAGVLRDAVHGGLLQPRMLTFTKRTSRLSVVLPWAVAATLALVVGYQTFGVAPPGAHVEMLSPVTLRSASRGVEAAVAMPNDGGAVTLALDAASLGADAPLQFVIRQGNGTVVASGALSRSEPGAPILLRVPAQLLKVGEHYALLVQPEAAAGLTANEYRFTVQAR